MSIPQNDPSHYSDSITILQRKIKLKGQALSLIRAEREEMKQRLFLHRMRAFLLRQNGPDFNPEVSRKLDCIDFLLGAR